MRRMLFGNDFMLADDLQKTSTGITCYKSSGAT